MGARLLAIALSVSSEPVNLTLDAPPCATLEQLQTELDALGARVTTPNASLARSFDVRIVPNDDGFEARLVVSDLIEKRERVVPAATCAAATRAAALLVSLALEEERPAPAAPPPPLAPPDLSLWSAPAEQPIASPRAPGSGGLAVLGTYGRSGVPESGMHVAGVRALAVARVWRGTRIGGAIGFASETERERMDSTMQWRSNGWSLRSGAVVAWGAPWNDSVVGFAGEVGAAVGHQSGQAAPGSVTGNECIYDARLNAKCYVPSNATPRSVTFVSPYVAGTLILQVPWRAPVRPIAALGVIARAGDADASQLGFTGELGLAWQAW